MKRLGGGYWRLEMRLGLVLGYGKAFGVDSGPWGGGRGLAPPPPPSSSDSLPVPLAPRLRARRVTDTWRLQKRCLPGDTPGPDGCLDRYMYCCCVLLGPSSVAAVYCCTDPVATANSYPWSTPFVALLKIIPLVTLITLNTNMWAGWQPPAEPTNPWAFLVTRPWFKSFKA